MTNVWKTCLLLTVALSTTGCSLLHCRRHLPENIPFASGVAHVGGYVRSPGKIDFDAPITIKQAIDRCGSVERITKRPEIAVQEVGFSQIVSPEVDVTDLTRLAERLSPEDRDKLLAFLQQVETGVTLGELNPQLAVLQGVAARQTEDLQPALSNALRELQTQLLRPATASPQVLPYVESDYFVAYSPAANDRSVTLYLPFDLLTNHGWGAINLRNGDEITVVPLSETSLANRQPNANAQVSFAGLVNDQPLKVASVAEILRTKRSSSARGRSALVELVRRRRSRDGHEIYWLPRGIAESSALSKYYLQDGDQVTIAPAYSLRSVRQSLLNPAIQESAHLATQAALADLRLRRSSGPASERIVFLRNALSRWKSLRGMY